MAGMKNYAAMAQGMPQQENPMELVQAGPEEIEAGQQLALSEEEMQAMNLPTGSEPEQVKARIVEMLERFDLLEGLPASDKMKIMEQVDLLVQDIISGNVEGVGKNPINNMLAGVSEQLRPLSESGEENAA